MSLDFAAIKEIRIVEVVSGHYHLPLRFRGDYANAQCPLPTHKEGDKGRSFSINVPGNYWRCFSESCNASNGGKKGGDVINFVAAMENCREKEAADKLARWFNIGSSAPQQKSAPHMEEPLTGIHQKTYSETSTSGDSVKYMASVELWFDTISPRKDGESDEEYRKRFLKALKSLMMESYRNGKAAKS